MADTKFAFIGLCFYISYSLLFIFYIIYGYKYLNFNDNIMILDNLNFSYTEYITNINVISPEEEESENFFINTTKIKTPLGFYKKGLYCNCYNNQSKSMIIKDIGICHFFGCDVKFDNTNNMIYSIYKWKNNSIYLEKSKYYYYQGINNKTKKCDEKLGFISCGYYDNIKSELCVKNDLKNCPYNNILFNEINLYLSLDNDDNIKINANISILDIMPYIKTKFNKNKNKNMLLFHHSLKEFLKENDIFNDYKYDKDIVYLIPIYNNIMNYNESIDNNNAFLEKYRINLEKILIPNDIDENTILFYILLIMMTLYLCSKVFIFPLFHLISIFCSTEIISLLSDKKYNELYTKFFSYITDPQHRNFSVIYFIKLLFEYPFFFRKIYNVRKINKRYEGHKWNSNFQKILNIEIAFNNINVILLLLYCFPLFAFFFLLFKLKILKLFKK